MPQEFEHYYGPHVHLINSPLLHGLLAELCAPETVQPRITHLVESLYRQLLYHAIHNEFGIEKFETPTRMTEKHPGCLARGIRVDRKQKVICVDIVRAGILPSQVCYQALHDFIGGELLRQDHVMAARVSNDADQVTGTDIQSIKIGGPKDGAIVLIPDPMGATGSTVITTVNHYKKSVPGKWVKAITLHLIVTPEYLREVQKHHPDLIIYAIRLDRGLSPQAILNTPMGLHWDQERGLNDSGYIVPGGGGFGEIMNNSYC